ncbi:hypothetical protein [Bacillus atrophaeus]|uniref:hypothetical protein n=1 Tax=Bacillus atrophaeus TaxID=1452 RepID=UPI00227DAC7E|nr:hypothetical protein [Bacillus atrophaeus]MCY8856472.1 hypothetical protein [Bacillus atrophaeus]
MNNIGEIISDFEGIIGALLGVIVTLILTHILKHFGAIKFYIVGFEINFISDNDDWGTNINSSKNEAMQAEIQSQIEIYNGAEIPKVLREIEFCFYKNTNLIVSVTPDDKATEEYAKFGYYRDMLFNINLPSKQIIDINLIKFLNEEETKQVKKCNRVYLEAKDHNGKFYKALLGEF